MKPGFDTISGPIGGRDPRVLELRAPNQMVVPVRASQRRQPQDQPRAKRQSWAYLGLIGVLALGTGHQAMGVADSGVRLQAANAPMQPVAVATTQVAVPNNAITAWELSAWTNFQTLLPPLPAALATLASQNGGLVASPTPPSGSSPIIAVTSPAHAKTTHSSQASSTQTVATTITSVATSVTSTLPITSPTHGASNPPASTSNPTSGSGSSSGGTTSTGPGVGGGTAPIVVTPTPPVTSSPTQPTSGSGGINQITTGVNQLVTSILGSLHF